MEVVMNILKWLFGHRHNWETTHVNRWEHPTRQICLDGKCGLTRKIEKGERKLMVKWDYSDGHETEEFDHFSSHKY